MILDNKNTYKSNKNRRFMRIVLILDINQFDLFFPQVFFQMEKKIFF